MVSFNFLFLPFRRIPSTSGGSENFFFSFLGNSQKWCLSIFYFFHFVEFQAPPFRGLWKLFLFVSWKFTEMVSFNFLFLPFRRIPSTSGGSENFFFSFLGNSQKWCLSIFYFFHFVEFQAPPGDSENFFFSFLGNSQKWCLSIFYFFHFVEFQAPPKTFSFRFWEIHRNGVFQFSISSIS